MNWNEIELNQAETGFIFAGKPLFDRKFIKVMSFHQEGLAAVYDHSGAYHIHLDGQPVYEARYLDAFGFYEGLATVRDDQGYFQIDIHGEPAHHERFRWSGNFQNGRCVVENEDGFYHIDSSGRAVYQDRYQYAGDYRHGLAVVHWNERAFHIDPNGKAIYPDRFFHAEPFHKGFAVVKDGTGYYHIRKNGKPTYSARFATIEAFYNGVAFGENFYGKKIRLRENGIYSCCHNYQPALTLAEIVTLCQSGATVALCLRHAARDKIPENDPNWGEGVPLNDHGRQEARQIGEALTGIPCSYHSSPVPRCIETCHCFSLGHSGVEPIVSITKVLGSPGPFFDESKSAELTMTQKNFMDFALSYLTHGIAPGMKAVSTGAEIMLGYIHKNMKQPLNIFISHDFFIALLSDFLGLRPVNRDHWCQYLEGFCCINLPNGRNEYRAFVANYDGRIKL
jgi:hypothetical protein